MSRRTTIAISLFVAGCSATSCGGKVAGLECASASECRAEHVCAPSIDGRTRCMLPCEAGVFMCDDGALCLDRGADGRLCWFGGTTPIRDECTETVECETGTACVESGAQSTCQQACIPEDDHICRAGMEECVPLPGGTGGWCREIVDGGAADAGSDAATTP